MLDVRRLRVLSEVASRESFSAAADALTLTQSAVSQHVSALEREVGPPLIMRGTRPVELTEAGYALTRHATGIFARLDDAEQELSEIAGRRHGRLRFGCFPTALATLMPTAFAQFRQHHPEVTLTVVDDHLHRLIPRLEAGELDLALIYDSVSLPDVAQRELERIPLLDDVFQAVLPAGHRLARRTGPIELSDLSAEPWIGGAPTSAWYRIASDACRRAGFTPRAGFASDDHIAVQALVAAGLGVSVIPGLAVTQPLRGVEVRTLRSGAPVRHISAARPRDGYHGTAVSAMIDSLRKASRNLAANSQPHD
ncbi:MAG: LysR family transcriptional regulator [Solirubrobacteraceae bacterium]